MLPPTDKRVKPWFQLMTEPSSAFASLWTQVLEIPAEPGVVVDPSPVCTNWASDHPWSPAGILAVVLLSQRNLSNQSRAKGLERMVEWHRHNPRQHESMRLGVSERCLVIWGLAAGNNIGKVFDVRRLGLEVFEDVVVESKSGQPTLCATHPDVVALPQSLANHRDRWPNRSRVVSRVRPILEAALGSPGRDVTPVERATWQAWLQEDLVTGLHRLDYHWVQALVEQEPEGVRRQATAVRLVDRLQKPGWRRARAHEDTKILCWQAEAHLRLGELFPQFRAYHRAQQALEKTCVRPLGRRVRA